MIVENKFLNGLPMRFSLYRTSRGTNAFLLVNGPKKVAENISMFLAFKGWFRRYYEDFPPPLYQLMQRNISLLLINKAVILGNLYRTMTKYIRGVKVDAIDLKYEPARDRKQIKLTIGYSYDLPTNVQSYKVIRFIQIN
jgi:hypothetical protein